MPEKTGASSSSYDFEKISKILSLVAIPVVIAGFGWVIQNRLSQQNLAQEYVKLSVSILEKPESSKVPPGLRDWAVDLLNQNSPTKFSAETIRQLKTGEINLAGIIGNVLATANNGGGIAVSPDGQTVATGQDDGTVKIWEISSGNLVKTFTGHSGTVWAVAYAPDQRFLFSGGSDRSVAVWDIRTGQLIRRFNVTSSVLGLAVSHDLKSLLVRTSDHGLRIFDLSSGELRSEVKLDSSYP
jgi:WD40 repeat protein